MILGGILIFFYVLNPLIYSFINVHLAMHSIWRRDTTPKGTKKTNVNTLWLAFLVSIELLVRNCIE